MKLWLVRMNDNSNCYVICTAIHRESAKQKAHHWFGSSLVYESTNQYGDPNHYIVTPLTNVGDRVHLDITVQI